MSFLDKINGGSEGEQMDLFDGKPFEDSIADAFEEESCDDEEIERILGQYQGSTFHGFNGNKVVIRLSNGNLATVIPKQDLLNRNDPVW